MLSKAYGVALRESAAFHQTHKTFSGSLAFPHAEPVAELIERVGARSLLDYGAGKGIQYEGDASLEKFWGIPVTKFDPAWPPYATTPVGQYDVVICTHVLGCIPIVDLPAIIDELYGLATKALYIGEVIGPAKKRVFSNPEAFPRQWTPEQWEQALTRTGCGIDVTLATQIPDGARTLKLFTKRLPR